MKVPMSGKNQVRRSKHWKNEAEIFQTLENPGTQTAVAAISDVAGQSAVSATCKVFEMGGGQ